MRNETLKNLLLTASLISASALLTAWAIQHQAHHQQTG